MKKKSKHISQHSPRVSSNVGPCGRKREYMTRTKKEIQDANALLRAMHVWLVANNMKHLFGDAINTIGAAIDEIHQEK
jgi:hypothetical protein